MRELGGYIEFEHYHSPMLHDGAAALNCGRNALAYVIRARKIRKLLVPRFLCASVWKLCARERVEYEFYQIGEDFLPRDLTVPEDSWLYLVNYYGQVGNEQILQFKEKYSRVIVDNSQAYFQMPVDGVDTIYTCRKFFGVADGAFLYTNAALQQELEQDESYERMRFLLGRFERTASEFYADYVANNEMFENEPLKRMSKLTDNLLHGIDYDAVMHQRTENYATLHKAFRSRNPLRLKIPNGAFMYPLYVEDGKTVRSRLHANKIYVPTLWPDVLSSCDAGELEYDLAENILPLPCDQRYQAGEMERLIQEVKTAAGY